jgi:metallo-beta-lactamase family protein
LCSNTLNQQTFTTTVKIVPLGAAGGEVTGSAYYVQTPKAKLLVDCGLFQGSKNADSKNRPPGGQRASVLDAVLVTHAHLDHTGRLPLLPQRDYTGPVYATPATCEMTALILRDSAKIQSQDIERLNRKRERAGEPPLQPLYSPQDAENVIAQLKPVPYQEPVSLAPGVQAVWAEAGHMLGSASIKLMVDDDGVRKSVVFSGDLGPKNAPILKDSEPFKTAEMVFLESTYGDRDHQPFRNTVKEFIEIVRIAVAAGGKMLVPTFAVGRAQLLTTLLTWIFRNGKVRPFPVFLDSPMAIEATKIYARHAELFDQEMKEFLNGGSIVDELQTLKTTVTAEDSKTINDQPGPCFIMAGAGMCNAGRILHHLKNNLWKPEAHVLIVGYQADGTLGRMLVEGAKSVKIFGEKIAVRAQVHTLGGFSAHAGQSDLLAWFETIAPAKPRVVLTHGEDAPRRSLAKLIQTQHGLRATLPAIGETIEL